MKSFTKTQFNIAANLLYAIDRECDCRIWNENNKNEAVYRKLKAAVRAWSYAVALKYISEEGEILVSDADIELAKEYKLKGSKVDWQGVLHKRYINDAEYRVSVNMGSKIIEIEGINDLTEAQNILSTYKGVFGEAQTNANPTYTELVLAGKYYE